MIVYVASVGAPLTLGTGMDKLFDTQVPLLGVLSAGFEVEQIGPAGSHRRVRFCGRGKVSRKRKADLTHLVTSSSPSTASVADVTVSSVTCRSSVRSLSSAIDRRSDSQSFWTSAWSAVVYSPSTLAQPSRTASIFSLET